MSVHDAPHALSSPPVPQPRGADRVDVIDAGPATVAGQAEAVARPQVHISWDEPGRRTAGARPSTDYWDVTTASWRSRGPQAG